MTADDIAFICLNRRHQRVKIGCGDLDAHIQFFRDLQKDIRFISHDLVVCTDITDGFAVRPGPVTKGPVVSGPCLLGHGLFGII